MSPSVCVCPEMGFPKMAGLLAERAGEVVRTRILPLVLALRAEGLALLVGVPVVVQGSLSAINVAAAVQGEACGGAGCERPSPAPNMAVLDAERDGDGVRVRDLPLVKELPPMSSPLIVSGKMGLLCWLPLVFVRPGVGVPRMAGLTDDPGGVGELAISSSLCPGAGVPKMAGLVTEREGEGVLAGALPRVWNSPLMSSPMVVIWWLDMFCMWMWPEVRPGVGRPRMAGLAEDLAGGGELVVA